MSEFNKKKFMLQVLSELVAEQITEVQAASLTACEFSVTDSGRFRMELGDVDIQFAPDELEAFNDCWGHFAQFCADNMEVARQKDRVYQTAKKSVGNKRGRISKGNLELAELELATTPN